MRNLQKQRIKNLKTELRRLKLNGAGMDEMIKVANEIQQVRGNKNNSKHYKFIENDKPNRKQRRK